jgi:hypothetical protein
LHLALQGKIFKITKEAIVKNEAIEYLAAVDEKLSRLIEKLGCCEISAQRN